jgi:hypothetical protein
MTAAAAASTATSIRAIDRLRKAANFEPIRQSVTLANGEEFEFYVKPLTAAEREKAQKNSKFANEFGVQVLILKAEDAEGQPLFAVGEAAILKQEIEDEVLQKMILCVLRPNGTEEEEADSKSN